jgi:hypothetical protein
LADLDISTDSFTLSEALGGVGVMTKVFHNYKGQVPANEFVSRSSIDCRYYGEHCLFVHWDGDITGCCYDNGKRQVAGTIADGIFSEAVQRRIDSFIGNPPPFCVDCLEEK